MKNAALLILCIAFSFPSISQNLSAKQLFKKYKNQEAVTSIAIPGFVAKMGALFMDKDDAELKYLIKKIKGLKLAVLEVDESQMNKKQLKKWSIHQLDPEQYEPLMTIQDGKERIHFLIHEQNNRIRELVMHIEDTDERILMLLTGKFDLKEINKLIQSINKDELKDLDVDFNM